MRMPSISVLIISGSILVAGAAAQAQPYGGPGMWGDGMMGGYGYGPGYGHGYMMGPGYGPGMMYGYDYGPRGHYYGRGPRYRGERQCWKETDSRGYGYYVPCRN